MSNPSATASTPLEAVKDVAKLNAQPKVTAGMVADGVTPLLIHCAFNPLAKATTVSLTLTPKSGGAAPLVVTQLYPSSPLLQAGEKEVWFQVKAIASEDLKLNPGSVELVAEVKLTGISSNPDTATFRIRKPPIVLVHGYGTDSGTWAESFLKTLYSKNHAPDFVIPVEYGVRITTKTLNTKFGSVDVVNKDKTGNTYGTLAGLAKALSQILEKQIEQQDLPWRKEWALTKYDIVGHSQGGVLSRMLCSTNADLFFGAQRYKSATNFNRGRFHRVITIGSPHNGSLIAHYLYRAKELRASIFTFWFPRYLVEDFLQPKFRLGSASQISMINSETHECDPDAKFRLITATINNGSRPGRDPFKDPIAYQATGLSNPGVTANSNILWEKSSPRGDQMAWLTSIAREQDIRPPISSSV